MAAFVEIEDFPLQLIRGQHSLDVDQLAVFFTNAVVANPTNISDLVEAVGSANIADKTLSTTGTSQTSGAASVAIADKTMAASGAMGPFQYAWTYNTVNGMLICRHDYPVEQNLVSGQSLILNFADANNYLLTVGIAQLVSAGLLSYSVAPDFSNGSYAVHLGVWDISSDDYFDPHDITMYTRYARNNPIVANTRLIVNFHGSSAGTGAQMQSTVISPPSVGDVGPSLLLMSPDAEAYNGSWREWWAYSIDGIAYTTRRTVAAIQYILNRYSSEMDLDKGYIFKGGSMGGGGAIFQALLLPAPHRSRVAYVTVAIGQPMARMDAGKYSGLWPADSGGTAVLWDAIDFAIQAANDADIRGIHYRHRFSTNDSNFSVAGQMAWVNILESESIAGEASWVQNGHSSNEPGNPNLPLSEYFDVSEQDVTIDRAHPAITNSTGNYPLTAANRLDVATYPRGHYNKGVYWDHASIVDSATEIIFPLKYVRTTTVGTGIPDQPASITVSVTPRRPKNFTIVDTEVLNWDWDNGALTGTATVSGDVVTVDNIPLASGDAYKSLRFYK